MHGSNKTPHRSLSGLLLGVLLFVVCFVVFDARLRVPVTGLLNLISAPEAMAATAEPQQAVSPAYRAGRQAGRADAQRDLPRDPRNNRYSTRQETRDYEAGYNRGYAEVLDSYDNDRGYGRYGRDDGRYERDDNRGYQREGTFVSIGRDNVVRWEAPSTARVYVQVDNEPMKLFAEGTSGSQQAPWIQSGHVYTFVARDMNGNEIARDRLDLRRFRR